MALTIYRRHSKLCPFFRRPRHARHNRYCKRQCSIWVEGAIAGRYMRRALDLTDWDVAAAVVHQWEAAAARGALPHSSTSTSNTQQAIAPPRATNESPLPTAADQPRSAASARPSVPHIREAVERFLRTLDKRHLSWETTRKYRGLLKGRLLSWCEREQLTALSALSVTRMDDFRETWTDGPGYAVKNVERLRAFFEFCVDREWIVRNPAKVVKTRQPRLTATLSYTDEEIARLIAACDRYRGNKDRMRAFVLTIRYSGLRISDMIALHPGQRVEDRLRLYTTKTGEPVYVPLPPFVVAALIKIERPGERYFTTGKAKPATDRANWSANLSRLFALASVENGRSHRFRDTFSTSLLERGASDETVAMLLGTTPAVVRKHYAPWIRSRQVALEAAVKATWQFPNEAPQSDVTTSDS
jgi:integrase/recombinase XerD